MHVMVVSPAALNKMTGLPIVLPITNGGNFARTAGFAVALAGSGTRTTGVVRCDQPFALDFAVRHGRKIETAPQYLVDDVLAKLIPIFE